MNGLVNDTGRMKEEDLMANPLLLSSPSLTIEHEIERAKTIKVSIEELSTYNAGYASGYIAGLEAAKKLL